MPVDGTDGDPLYPYLKGPAALAKKNGCFRASDGVIRLSGLSAKQRSRRSMKW